MRKPAARVIADQRAVCEAFRDRRFMVRGELTSLGNASAYARLILCSHGIAWRTPSGLYAMLFGLPHAAVPVLNTLCEVYGLGHPYRVDETTNAFYFNTMEISTQKRQHLLGPLGAQAIEHEAEHYSRGK